MKKDTENIGRPQEGKQDKGRRDHFKYSGTLKYFWLRLFMEVSIRRMSGTAEFYNEIAKDALKIRMDSSLTVFGYQILKKVSSHLRRHF